MIESYTNECDGFLFSLFSSNNQNPIQKENVNRDEMRQHCTHTTHNKLNGIGREKNDELDTGADVEKDVKEGRKCNEHDHWL